MKNVVITGFSSDIGFAIAERLAQEGWNLYLLNEHEAEAGKLAKLEKYQREVKVYQVDLTDTQKLEAVFIAIGKDAGTIHGLVNNAGIYPSVAFGEYTLELWEKVMAVNLTAPFYCIQKALPFMKEQGGKIVNISSTGAHLGSRDAAYSASKAGLIGLTKSCARSLAQYNIQVNAVAPGMIDTQRSREVKSPDRQKTIEASLIKREGTPNEVAGVVHFLLSSDADYMTGTTLDVNGGLHIR